MAKRFLEDMVKIKREGNMAKAVYKPISPKEAVEKVKVEPKIEIRNEARNEPEVENVKFKKIKDELYGNTRSSHDTGRTGRKHYLWIIALISAIFLLFAISFLFSRATVTINPKIKDVVLNENLSAAKDSGSSGLPFDLVAISGEESKTLEAKEQKEVALSAKGTVIIYNNFSSSTQGLDIDTRLEGSNGKIYKTVKKVVVPGKSGNTPGAIEVDIYASAPGVEYNSGPLDFKIFGFKGTPKYSGFYARSKGEISGGFKGTAAFISDEERASAINDLKTTLQAKLLQKAKDQIPSGFILFPNAVYLETEEVQIPLVAKDNTLPISQKGTLYGILFNESKLTQKIVKDNIENYDGSEVYVSNISNLNFSLSSGTTGSFADIKNINFNLSGSAKVVWKFDPFDLATELSGRSKKDFNQILAGHPNIESAVLKLTPPWMWSIPSKAAEIKIIANYPH